MKNGIFIMGISVVLSACAAAPTPPARLTLNLQPALLPLAGFIGERHCAGSFLKSGKAITSVESFSVDLSGYWLVMRHADEPPFPFDAVEMWGYDAKAQHFVAYIYDNFGGMRQYASPGWDGDRFVLTNVDTSNPKRDRFVFEKQPNSAYQFTYETSSDGITWTGADSLTCT